MVEVLWAQQSLGADVQRRSLQSNIIENKGRCDIAYDNMKCRPVNKARGDRLGSKILSLGATRNRTCAPSSLWTRIQWVTCKQLAGKSSITTGAWSTAARTD